MNCPQCEQSIAPDSFRIGPYVDERDQLTGQVIGCARTIILRCAHCGLFTCEEDARGFIRDIQHLTNRKDVRRLDRKLARRSASRTASRVTSSEVAA